MLALGDAPLAGITYIATGEGWLYLAAVLDLATRKIVGWSSFARGLPRSESTAWRLSGRYTAVPSFAAGRR